MKKRPMKKLKKNERAGTKNKTKKSYRRYIGRRLKSTTSVHLPLPCTLDGERARTQPIVSRHVETRYLPAAFISVTFSGEPGLEVISTSRGGDLSREARGWPGALEVRPPPSGLSEWFSINMGMASSPLRPGPRGGRQDRRERKDTVRPGTRSPHYPHRQGAPDPVQRQEGNSAISL